MLLSRRKLMLAAVTAAQEGGVRAVMAADFLDRLAAYGFLGVIGLAARGLIVLERGVGEGHTKDTVISIGSITKQFTAAAILKLEMAGGLKTEDSIAKHLPGVAPDKAAITIHHLLTHTAGLRPDYGPSDYEQVGREEYIRRVMEAPLGGAPGEEHRYSNAGYSLAAAIVELKSGGSYEAFCRKQLFEPAGMMRTGYLLPKFRVDELAVGYRDGERWGTILERPMAADGPYWNLRGNGGIHSTAGDMLRWHLALESGKVLNPEARKKFETGYVNEGPMGRYKYAYGWSVSESPFGKLVEHNGGNGIFAADFLRYVDRGVALYVASSVAEWPAIPLSHPLARIAFGENIPLPPKAVALPEAMLRRWAGEYELDGGDAVRFDVKGPRLAATGNGQAAFSLLATGRAEAGKRALELNERSRKILEDQSAGKFESTKQAMGPDVPLERIRTNQGRIWKEARERMGKLKRIEILGSAPRGEELITYARLLFEKGNELIVHIWSPEGELVGVRLGGPAPRSEFVPISENEAASFNLQTLRATVARFEAESVEIGGVKARKR